MNYCRIIAFSLSSGFLCASLVIASRADAPAPRAIKAVVTTEPVASDPDDPAIWVNRRNPAQSLVIGTNKAAKADGGALYVWGLDGKTRQIFKDLDRPNNVDLEYDFALGQKRVALVAVTERLTSRLRLYQIAPDTGTLSEIAPVGGIPVFAGETGEEAAPMGVSLFRRPSDGVVFAVVGRKSGPTTGGYLWQYRLDDDGTGGVRGVKVRAFGAYSGKKEIEAIAVDDALGFVYYADERVGIRKYNADPDVKDANREVALFATTGFKADHEGIGIVATGEKTGFIVATDQLPRSSEYHLFRREGEPNRPHDHTRTVAIVKGGADSTDGLDITSAPMGKAFPHGLMAVMNSGPKNFLLFRTDDVLPHVNAEKFKPGPAAAPPVTVRKAQGVLVRPSRSENRPRTPAPRR